MQQLIPHNIRLSRKARVGVSADSIPERRHLTTKLSIVRSPLGDVRLRFGAGGRHPRKLNREKFKRGKRDMFDREALKAEEKHKKKKAVIAPETETETNVSAFRETNCAIDFLFSFQR